MTRARVEIQYSGKQNEREPYPKPRHAGVDLAYAARILRIARLESEGFERQARKRRNFIASGFGFEILRRGSQYLRANTERREQNAVKEPARI